MSRIRKVFIERVKGTKSNIWIIRIRDYSWVKWAYDRRVRVYFFLYFFRNHRLIPAFPKPRSKSYPTALPFGDNSFSSHSFTFLHFQVLDFLSE